jgi:hypothetical protein
VNSLTRSHRYIDASWMNARLVSRKLIESRGKPIVVRLARCEREPMRCLIGRMTAPPIIPQERMRNLITHQMSLLRDVILANECPPHFNILCDDSGEHVRR